MTDFSAVAIFCEDIRQDVNGTHSLIGIMSDNIAVPHFPGGMPKLGIYVRILFHQQRAPTSLNIFLNRPDGAREPLITVERDFVESSFKEAADAKNLQMTIFSQLIASPFPVLTSGRHWIELVWDGGSLDIGGLNFVLQSEVPSQQPPSP